MRVQLLGVVALAVAATAPAAAVPPREVPEVTVRAVCFGGPSVSTEVTQRAGRTEVRVLITGAGPRTTWGGSAEVVTDFADGTTVHGNATLGGIVADSQGAIRDDFGFGPGDRTYWTTMGRLDDDKARCSFGGTASR